MTVTKINYGLSLGLPLIANLNGLISSISAAAETAHYGNLTDLFDDMLVQVRVKTAGSGTIGSDQAVYVYVAGSADGSTWPDTCTGAATATGATIALVSPTNLRLVAVINTPALGTVYTSEPFVIAAAFGGVLPPNFSFVVRNYCGVALDASAGGSMVFTGIYYTSA